MMLVLIKGITNLTKLNEIPNNFSGISLEFFLHQALVAY